MTTNPADDALPDDLITIKEAAALCHGTHQATVRRWILNGRLRGYQIAGRKYLVSKADLLGMIAPVVVPDKPLYPPTAKEVRQDAEWVDKVLREAKIRK